MTFGYYTLQTGYGLSETFVPQQQQSIKPQNFTRNINREIRKFGKNFEETNKRLTSLEKDTSDIKNTHLKNIEERVYKLENMKAIANLKKDVLLLQQDIQTLNNKDLSIQQRLQQLEDTNRMVQPVMEEELIPETQNFYL